MPFLSSGIFYQIVHGIACSICRATTKEKPDQFLPTSSKEISWKDLYAKLAVMFPEAQIYLSHFTYKLASWDDIALFLAYDETDEIEYQEDRYMCGSFALRLMGQFSIPGWADLTFGVVETHVHRLNCFIDENGKFYYIEPQTDNRENKLLAWQGSKVKYIIM